MTREVRQAIRICPEHVRQALTDLCAGDELGLEELRFRTGRKMQARTNSRAYDLQIPVTQDLLNELTERATRQSAYAMQDMLRCGFVTLAGGHRLGICGTAVLREREIQTIRSISSLNLRIARELRGVGESCAAYLWTHPASTLLLGAPGAGKTTLLRDVIRLLSDRHGRRVCVVDDRQEIAACLDGMPQFDLGGNTDVLSGAPKGKSMELLLRSMNPQWIALDEITAEEDIQAILRASYCGVKLLATAHAGSRQELFSRPLYRRLMEAGIFRNLICLSADHKISIERGEAG